MNDKNQLVLKNVSCIRQYNTLVNDLSLTAKNADILHIVGPNGAGKTSLLKIIVGLLKPSTGHVTWNNINISENPTFYHQCLTFIGHKAAVKAELSVLENIQTQLLLRGISLNNNLIEEKINNFIPNHLLHIQAGYLSAGQQRRIALARLLLEPSKLWVLDEPYTALDSLSSQILSEIINKAMDNGNIIIFTSHQPLKGIRKTPIEIHLGG